MSRVTHTDELCPTHSWVVPPRQLEAGTRISCVTSMNVLCHAHKGVVSHIHESWVVPQQLQAEIRMSRVTRINVSFHAYTRCGIDMNESSHNNSIRQSLPKIQHPRNPPNRETKFFGNSQCEFKLRFGFNLNLYRGIWVFGFGGFQGCSIFSANCHFFRLVIHIFIRTYKHIYDSAYTYIHMCIYTCSWWRIYIYS